MAGQSFGDFIRRWEQFNSALKPLLADLPHLAQDQAEFEALVTQARNLDDQQKQLRGKAQDMTQQRKVIFLKGLDQHERLASQLKGVLGSRNQNLVGFGLRPRKVPKRRKGENPDAPPPSPPPSPPPTQPPPVEAQSKGTVVPKAQEVTPSVAAAG